MCIVWMDRLYRWKDIRSILGMGHQLTFFQLVTNSTSGSAVLHECSLFNLIISLSFSFQEYLACSQGVVNRWSSRKCRFHIIDLSAVSTHEDIVEDKYDIFSQPSIPNWLTTPIIRTCGFETASFTKDFLDRMATPLAQGHCHDYQVINSTRLDDKMKLLEQSSMTTDETSIFFRWVLHSARWTQTQFCRTRALPYNSLWS